MSWCIGRRARNSGPEAPSLADPLRLDGSKWSDKPARIPQSSALFHRARYAASPFLTFHPFVEHGQDLPRVDNGCGRAATGTEVSILRGPLFDTHLACLGACRLTSVFHWADERKRHRLFDYVRPPCFEYDVPLQLGAPPHRSRPVNDYGSKPRRNASATH
jgi:hypothetical protein